jgi:hypothetical protein
MTDDLTDITGDARRSDTLTFNRVTTAIKRDFIRGGFRIVITYWSTDHRHRRAERSTATFESEQVARDIATRLATDIGDRIRT